MPIHNFRCPNCGLFERFQSIDELRDEETCQVCGSTSRKTFELFTHNNGGGVRIFKPMWFEHIAPEPIYVESRKQLREECEKRGKYSQYIEDSYNRRF